MTQKAIILDRDGTINIDKGYLFEPSGLEFEDHALEGLKLLMLNNYQLIVATNQSGISKGYYTEDNMHVFHKVMTKKLNDIGIIIAQYYYCPHHPQAKIPEYKQNCSCRKPATGMLEKAIKDFSIDISNSWMIGDKESDVEAGIKVGLRTALVKTGKGINFFENTKADITVENLEHFAKYVVFGEL